MDAIEVAVFGNRGGSHQLLDSSLSMNDAALDKLRFLVDRPPGHIGSEVTWSPYWGCQQAEHWWALWRGEEDLSAPRRNMVTARVALVPVQRCVRMETLGEMMAFVGAALDVDNALAQQLACAAASCISSGHGPAIIPGISSAPLVLAALWPRLWPKARASLSLRTLFSAESMASVSRSSIVVFPSELKQRWRGERLLYPPGATDGLAARWFRAKASVHEERLVKANEVSLPADFAAFDRVERIARCLTRLRNCTGTVADALLVSRTQEAFPDGFVLPPEEQQLVRSALTRFDSASIDEVRAASLTALDAIPELCEVEAALSRWVEHSLPTQSTDDALWILEQHTAKTHACWWRRAIGTGIRMGCTTKTQAWAAAIWCWWQTDPDSVVSTTDHLAGDYETEQWLASNTPQNLDDKLIAIIARISRQREWGTLLGRALGPNRPLLRCIETLIQNLTNPASALNALLLRRDHAEIVDAAAATLWPPLIASAVSYTVANPQLLIRAFGSSRFVPLLAHHLSEGGGLPADLMRPSFLHQVLDGIIQGNADYLAIVEHLDGTAGHFVLDHRHCEQLLPRIPAALFHGTVEEWWRRFLSADGIDRPPASLWPHVAQSARSRLDGAPIVSVIRFLHIAREIVEQDFVAWMNDTGFRWELGDHQQVANLLMEREWQAAATAFRWSWKRELVLVAWYARDMLSGRNRFLRPPRADESPKVANATTRNAMVLLFLAANPLKSSRLCLDEEARDIEGKIRASKYRDLITVKTHWAVRPEDLQEILLHDQPTVVHFSGHGDIAGIVLHSSDQADERIVGAEALAELFGLFKDDIRVVVLNACFSEPQAKAIVKEIDFVIGMNDSIGDDAARVFSAAFYRALAFGRSVKKAFKLGINELKLVGLCDDVTLLPRLLNRQGVDAGAYHLVSER